MFALFRRLKEKGTTILLVEQNVERALALSDRAYILDQGRVVHPGTGAELLADREIQDRYCAVRPALLAVGRCGIDSLGIAQGRAQAVPAAVGWS